MNLKMAAELWYKKKFLCYISIIFKNSHKFMRFQYDNENYFLNCNYEESFNFKPKLPK